MCCTPYEVSRLERARLSASHLQTCSKRTKFGRKHATFGRHPPNLIVAAAILADTRPNSAELNPELVEARPNLADTGRTLVDTCPMLAGASEESVEAIPDPVNATPTLAEISPDSVEASQIWSKPLLNISPNSIEARTTLVDTGTHASKSSNIWR